MDEIKITAQIVGCKTLKVAGGMRVELDIFESREVDIAQMAILANRRVTALVTFENVKETTEKDEKKEKKRKPGQKIAEIDA